jgi:signal transduction histidine kinase
MEENLSVARSLTRRYIFALSLVALLTTAAWFSLHLVIQEEKSIAAVVNVSGRQRMLSQRTALFSSLLANAAPTDRPAIRAQLVKAADLMARSHRGLTHGDVEMGLPAEMSASVRSMYFEAPLQLDQQVQAYLANIETLLQMPDAQLGPGSPVLSAIIKVAPSTLVQSLDKMVTQYQTEGEAAVKRLIVMETIVWLLTLLLLLAEARFIFRPIVLHTRKVISEQQRLAAHLASAKEVAEAANRAKSAFLANMSHEFRTPLNAIAGMGYLIRRGGLNPAQSGQLDKLEAAGNKLLEIISDILELSKIEAGRVDIEAAPLQVEQIVAQVQSQIQGVADKKGITLLAELGAFPTNLQGDAARLGQALSNYASNAIKFTEAGSVTLHAKMVEETPDDALLRFEVRDTGIGIAPEAVSRIFTAFEQADNSTTRKYGGTGLGLAITQRLVHLMGGNVGAESAVGAGSVFWFTARVRKVVPQ